MIVLINPNLVVQRNDPFTTGIVYMPIGLAYAASCLREAGFSIRVIDAFAEKPYKVSREDKFMFIGLSNEEIAEKISLDTRIIFIYAINTTNHISTIRIIHGLKQFYPSIPLVVLENTQAVTGYSLSLTAKEFYKAGADYILTGEYEISIVQLVDALINNNKQLHMIEGLGSPEFFNEPVNKIENLDSLPFPAWDTFPLENYWKIKFAHGPFTSKRYLPILTSRGCPYNCKFCFIPYSNKRIWRERTAKNVVDEIEFFMHRYNVHEFHIEDVNPTVSDNRMREISNEILNRNLKISWKIVAGTKVETIKNVDTVELMAKSGCKYISISPETGSPRLLRMINKPFNLNHAETIIKKMNQVGIRSQACFVLGYPGETKNDLKMTKKLIKTLTLNGVDEIAIFIITPIPGSAIYNEFKGYKMLSELNFSPCWRNDYKQLNKYRLHLYIYFLFLKFLYHPFKIFRQILNFFCKRFETKMEMVPYRAMVFKLLDMISSKRIK